MNNSKEDKVRKLYDEVLKEHEKAGQNGKYNLIQDLKTKLEKEIKDKTDYIEYKLICQRNSMEDVSIALAVIAILIALGGAVVSLFSAENVKIIGAVLMFLCIVASAVIAYYTKAVLGDRHKYKMTELILDEIYKEKFETADGTKVRGGEDR